jgi:hypothetical protein
MSTQELPRALSMFPKIRMFAARNAFHFSTFLLFLCETAHEQRNIKYTLFSKSIGAARMVNW